jgi:hypothetical protein
MMHKIHQQFMLEEVLSLWQNRLKQQSTKMYKSPELSSTTVVDCWVSVDIHIIFTQWYSYRILDPWTFDPYDILSLWYLTPLLYFLLSLSTAISFVQLFTSLQMAYKYLLYFRYVRSIQNQNPAPSQNSLPRKNKVKKASHEKKQVSFYHMCSSCAYEPQISILIVDNGLE